MGHGGKNPHSLLGKLLLSSALLAVSLAYGWWQRHAGPDLAAAPVPSDRLRALNSAGETARPPSAAPLSALASLPMYQPPPVQTPLPLVTGTPAAGPAGMHLEDGDYLSDMEQFEWGDLRVKISVRGGRITGVQLVQYPDHRAESLEISQMASPILDSEVIKTQQAKVDVVSSATETSYVFRDAVAGAIGKAARR